MRDVRITARQDRGGAFVASRRADLLFAVWDGGPSRKVGDTAHVVSVARDRRIPVAVFWPPGAQSR